jgi:hypothetical protein
MAAAPWPQACISLGHGQPPFELGGVEGVGVFGACGLAHRRRPRRPGKLPCHKAVHGAQRPGHGGRVVVQAQRAGDRRGALLAERRQHTEGPGVDIRAGPVVQIRQRRNDPAVPHLQPETRERRQIAGDAGFAHGEPAHVEEDGQPIGPHVGPAHQVAHLSGAVVRSIAGVIGRTPGQVSGGDAVRGEP